MDIRSLRYFTETVRLGSFTDAARHLGVTQSTISKMIRQLEDELGEVLLLRDVRGLAPTDTGRVVYERGREILAAMQQLEQEVRETQAVARGRLALGMPPMINILFTEVLKRFRQKHPGVELLLHERTGRQVEQLVEVGELAAGMSVMPVDPRAGIAVAHVASHRVWALAAEGTLKGEAETVALRTVAQSPLVLLNDDFALTRLLRRHFARADVEPRIAAQRSVGLDGFDGPGRMGVALLPEPFIERINKRGLVCKPVSQPEVLWEITLLWNPDRSSHALQAWLELCKEVLGGEWPDSPEDKA